MSLDGGGGVIGPETDVLATGSSKLVDFLFNLKEKNVIRKMKT